MNKRVNQLRLRLQKMLNQLTLTSTNSEAERLRSEIMTKIVNNKWAIVHIENGKIVVKEIKR